jgi:hypothetical protein
MQTGRLLQAVVVLGIISVTTGCAASKEYSAKVFGPRTEPVKDSVRAIRFLELEKINEQEEGWVTTDIVKKDSTVIVSKPAPETEKTIPVATEPVAKTTVINGTRNKTSREDK